MRVCTRPAAVGCAGRLAGGAGGPMSKNSSGWTTLVGSVSIPAWTVEQTSIMSLDCGVRKGRHEFWNFNVSGKVDR
jgi:hypothetical protein